MDLCAYLSPRGKRFVACRTYQNSFNAKPYFDPEELFSLVLDCNGGCNELYESHSLEGWSGVSCNACGSDNQAGFNGEVAIHFPGLEGLDKPIVWVFPQILVCVKCGASQFAIPNDELSVLRNESGLSEVA